MDMCLYSYTAKGSCIWSMKQPAKITALTAIDIEILGLRLIGVALENNQVNFYHDRNKVDTIETEDIITSMKFGRYGREDNTLVMVSRNGTLIIKILKRTAKFYSKEISDSASSVSISEKLNIPKKTKLFVDQTMREREESTSKLNINVEMKLL